MDHIPNQKTTQQKFKSNTSANNFRIVTTTSPSHLNILGSMHIHKEKLILNIYQQATELLNII